LFLAAVRAGATGYFAEGCFGRRCRRRRSRHLARRSGVSAATGYAVGHEGLSKGTRGIGASC
jgi:hypothetical protein